jgi:hypothetical protein
MQQYARWRIGSQSTALRHVLGRPCKTSAGPEESARLISGRAGGLSDPRVHRLAPGGDRPVPTRVRQALQTVTRRLPDGVRRILVRRPLLPHRGPDAVPPCPWNPLIVLCACPVAVSTVSAVSAVSAATAGLRRLQRSASGGAVRRTDPGTIRTRRSAVRLEPAARLVRLEPAARLVRLEPAAQLVRLEPAARLVRLEPAARLVRLEPAARLVRLEPAARLVRLEPAARLVRIETAARRLL